MVMTSTATGKSIETRGSKPKILLSGVFGPYGVDDAFGRASNLMELWHNQITKAQRVASLRAFFRSNGLYFLAENVTAPVTILDFPSRKRFIAELKAHRYDLVGISFIASNMLKAKEMARLVREHLPDAEIVLGGHGAAIENIETLIPCDHVVRGEGIRWLQRYLGEDDSAPIHHPFLMGDEFSQIYGITTRNYPKPGKGARRSATIVPGVGCVNGCHFCSTTHFFGKEYTPFLDSAERIYSELCRAADALRCNEFRIMDENFLKDLDRARALQRLIEEGGRPFRLAVFSSAETIEVFGLENMVRMGIYSVWIGVESRFSTFAKNQGRDLQAIVAALRKHGILVIVSSILFVDEHTPETIWQDVDYALSMNACFTQFMHLTPLPVTALYKSYKEQGRLLFDLPYEDWHGQEKLNFKHPHFSSAEASEIIKMAFQKEYETLSSSMCRVVDTLLQGVRTLKDLSQKDPWIAIRRDDMVSQAKRMRVLFWTMRYHAVNDLERQRIDALSAEYEQEFGRLPLIGQILRAVALIISIGYSWRVGILGDSKSPRTLVTRYRWG